jgi:GNAT superfamily N-acetyltransferase
VPEDRDATIRAFSHVNDWFETGKAAGFYVPGHARIAVFRPESFAVDRRQAAVFGYWEHECTSDVANVLFEEAEAWARAAGAEVLYGPIDFNTSRRYRVRLNAEPDGPTFLGEPYNPPVYPPLLEAAGYRVARWYVSQIGMRQPVRVEHKERVRDAVVASGYSIETLDSAVWRANIVHFKRLADAVFAGNFAFSPESLATFAAGYGEAIARQLCPRSSLLVRDHGGTIVGFLLIYPHYGSLVAQRAGASRIAVSDLSFDEHCPMLERAGERTAVVRTIGVNPDHRARGVMDALMAEAVARGVRCYDRWIGALIEASNWSRRFGASQTDYERMYALFAKDLAARQ